MNRTFFVRKDNIIGVETLYKLNCLQITGGVSLFILLLCVPCRVGEEKQEKEELYRFWTTWSCWCFSNSYLRQLCDSKKRLIRRCNFERDLVPGRQRVFPNFCRPPLLSWNAPVVQTMPPHHLYPPLLSVGRLPIRLHHQLPIDSRLVCDEYRSPQDERLIALYTPFRLSNQKIIPPGVLNHILILYFFISSYFLFFVFTLLSLFVFLFEIEFL